MRLQGWEQFHESVDRIVSIGAFEHFGPDRYDDFFKMAYEALPADGVMMLHTIVKPSDEEFTERGLPMTMRQLRFFKFIMDEIFPGGDCRGRGGRGARGQGRFPVERVQSFGRTTPARWTSGPTALEARKDEAIAIQSEEVYDRYMRYLTGCAELFRDGYTDVCQFTLVKN